MYDLLLILIGLQTSHNFNVIKINSIFDQIDKDALDKQVKEKKMLQDQEEAKNQAYTNKLLQDCETSLKSDEQKKKVTSQYL